MKSSYWVLTRCSVTEANRSTNRPDACSPKRSKGRAARSVLTGVHARVAENVAVAAVRTTDLCKSRVPRTRSAGSRAAPLDCRGRAPRASGWAQQRGPSSRSREAPGASRELALRRIRDQVRRPPIGDEEIERVVAPRASSVSMAISPQLRPPLPNPARRSPTAPAIAARDPDRRTAGWSMLRKHPLHSLRARSLRPRVSRCRYHPVGCFPQIRDPRAGRSKNSSRFAAITSEALRECSGSGQSACTRLGSRPNHRPQAKPRLHRLRAGGLSGEGALSLPN